MTEAFEDWLVNQAESGDETVLDRLGVWIDGHLAGFPPHQVATERIRVARAFQDRMPDGDLGRRMLAQILRQGSTR